MAINPYLHCSPTSVISMLSFRRIYVFRDGHKMAHEIKFIRNSGCFVVHEVISVEGHPAQIFYEIWCCS